MTQTRVLGYSVLPATEWCLWVWRAMTPKYLVHSERLKPRGILQSPGEGQMDLSNLLSPLFFFVWLQAWLHLPHIGLVETNKTIGSAVHWRWSNFIQFADCALSPGACISMHVSTNGSLSQHNPLALTHFLALSQTHTVNSLLKLIFLFSRASVSN